MLGVGGAATVAAEVDFAAVAERFDDHVGRLADAVQKGVIVEYGLLGGDALLD